MNTPQNLRRAVVIMPLLLLAFLAEKTGYGDGVSSIHVCDFLPPAQRSRLPRALLKGSEVTLSVPGDTIFNSYNGETISSVTRDRIVLGSEGVVARLLKAGQTGGLPDAPVVAIKVKVKPAALPTLLSFDKYLTDPTLFTHQQFNEILYHMKLGVKPKDYRFAGFARSHGVTYVGVYYTDGNGSDQRFGMNEAAFLIFRLEKTPQGIWEPRAIPLPSLGKREDDEIELSRPLPELIGGPLLDIAQDEGDLYLIYKDFLWRRDAAGTWTNTGSLYSLLPSSLSTSPKASGGKVVPDRWPAPGYPPESNEYFLRGRWLIVVSSFDSRGHPRNPSGDPNGDRPRVEEKYSANSVVHVFDVRSRKLARTMYWTHYRTGIYER